MVITITIVNADTIRKRAKMTKNSKDKDAITVYTSNNPVVKLVINPVLLLINSVLIPIA